MDAEGPALIPGHRVEGGGLACRQAHTWKRTAEDLLQCTEMGAKPYRASSTPRLKAFQGTAANCSGTEA